VYGIKYQSKYDHRQEEQERLGQRKGNPSGQMCRGGANGGTDIAVEPIREGRRLARDQIEDRGKGGKQIYDDYCFGQAVESRIDGRGLGGNRCTVGGTWGVGLQLNGVSFVEGLSHDFNVTYIGGTNSKYNASYGSPYDYMTTEDGAVEFGFLTTYKIYKNLTAALDLSYIVEDYDTSAGRGSFENDWSAALCFEFRF